MVRFNGHHKRRHIPSANINQNSTVNAVYNKFYQQSLDMNNARIISIEPRNKVWFSIENGTIYALPLFGDYSGPFKVLTQNPNSIEFKLKFNFSPSSSLFSPSKHLLLALFNISSVVFNNSPLNRYFIVQTLSLAMNISDSLLTIHKINGSLIKVYFSCDLYSSKDLSYQIQKLIDHYHSNRLELMTYFSLPLIEISIIRISKQSTTTPIIELKKAFVSVRPRLLSNQTIISSRNNLIFFDQFYQPLVIVPLVIISIGLIICTIIAFCLCCNRHSSSSSSTLLLSNGSFVTPTNKHLYQKHRQQREVYRKKHYFQDQRQFISKGIPVVFTEELEEKLEQTHTPLFRHAKINLSNRCNKQQQQQQQQQRSIQTSTDHFASVEEQVKEQQKRNEEVQDMPELVRDFLDPAEFYRQVKNICGINFFCGVPDSLLKDFCAYVTANVPSSHHIITANEGSAIGLACGSYMGTGQPSLVYLQNSGLGNIVNPIMSLAAPGVYSLPMLLLIGWRGEPAALGIPFQPLPDYHDGAGQALETAKRYMETAKGPYALLVKRQTFLPYSLPKRNGDAAAGLSLTREEALKCVLSHFQHRDVVVGTTGMLSRELFELRMKRGDGHERDFLTVGGMGHASSIALGIAIQKPSRTIYCLDGDGAVLMHMGVLANIAAAAPSNFKHIVFNNGTHDSVGGQPTVAGDHKQFSFSQVAQGCGYKHVFIASNQNDITEAMEKIRSINNDGPVLLELRIKAGHRKNLGRPTLSTNENRKDFMHFLQLN
ncbi:unnamed protein product [Rotaria magnacalcarata]|uniref:2-hydroxyacyl-CoA lyase 2 n=4 Tax=Rotaria magnacalcarata TaxID=392030 RepID=A0A819HAF6_9BILA|nr:unnamed protein product [Rotaria magnacalcarata]